MEETVGKINENTACWYAIYTASRTEKNVTELLKQSGFEYYFPLCSVKRVWNNHTKKIFIPIIPRIVFVCLSKGDMDQVSSLGTGIRLLREREAEHYLSFSTDQMKVFSQAIAQAGEYTKFVFDSCEAEVLPSTGHEPLRGIAGEYKRMLSIKGLGDVLMKRSDLEPEIK